MFKQYRLAQLALCLVVGVVASILIGQDSSWDLRNYHLYNPFAFMTGRFGLDFFPADQQTGFNPTIDIPYAYLALGPLADYPHLLAAYMGLPYGLLIFFTWLIAEHVFAPIAEPEKHIWIGVATITAVTGAIDHSQIASTSNDDTIGMMVLAGLFCILCASRTWRWPHIVLGGLLFGLAAGLKLTALIYAPALVLALLVSLPLCNSLRCSGFFSMGWLVGFAASYGWWGWTLWSKFGNPTFPLFNKIFKSPLGPIENLRDLRFMPHGIWQTLFYPFSWAINPNSHTVHEMMFRDPRIAFAFTAILICIFIVVRKPSHDRATHTQFTPPQKMTILFLVFSYALWLATTSILRYAVPIETLSVLAFLLVIMRFSPSLSSIHPRTPIVVGSA